MHTNSPHYLFHRDSPGWLIRRSAKGEHISKEDVVRVLKADPTCALHPVVADLMRKALLEELPKKRGRKRGPARRLKELYVLTIYEEVSARLAARRARQRATGIYLRSCHYLPSELAQELIARRTGFATPEGVRNLISSLKREQNCR
jgi:hypothetical protein